MDKKTTLIGGPFDGMTLETRGANWVCKPLEGWDTFVWIEAPLDYQIDCEDRGISISIRRNAGGYSAEDGEYSAEATVYGMRISRPAVDRLASQIANSIATLRIMTTDN
jgi:hypothetical protein